MKHANLSSEEGDSAAADSARPVGTEIEDRVWKALADPTRRRLLDLLRGERATTGELCEQFPRLTRYAVMKHLGVLERAGLVRVAREGRLRWNSLDAAPIQTIYDRWLSPHVVPNVHASAPLERRTDCDQ